jgi:hypothetical protein
MRSLPMRKSASPRSPFGACETESVTWIKRQATWVGNAVSSGPEDVAGVPGDEFAAKASLRLRGRTTLANVPIFDQNRYGLPLSRLG